MMIFLFVLIARLVDEAFTQPFDPILYGFYCVSTLFVIILTTGIRYTIDETTLTVSVAGIYRKNYDIRKITCIKSSHAPFAAPAVSLDRLKIYYGDKRLYLSPRRKAAFVKQIKEINPAVRVEL